MCDYRRPLNGLAVIWREISETFKLVQTGRVRSYATMFLLGVLALLPTCQDGWGMGIDSLSLVIFPLVGILLLLLVPSRQHDTIKGVSLVISIVTMICHLQSGRCLTMSPAACSSNSMYRG